MTDSVSTPVRTPASTPEKLSADFMSDLHVDKWDGETYDYAAHKKSDIAIVAGDVADGSAAALAELKRIAAVYKTVLFVDGNHEFRKAEKAYNFDFAAVEKELRDGIAGIPNVTYLRDKPFVKDGVAIIGRNGHWDYKIADGITEKDAIDDAAKEFKSTFNEAASFSKLARRDYYALREQVISLNKDPSIHTIVVVTHTVPRQELLNRTYSLNWLSRGGASVMRRLQPYDTHNKIKFWLFGHSHEQIQQSIDGVFYRENPRGKKKEANTDYKPATMAFH
jgi:predicted phosphodiesterase